MKLFFILFLSTFSAVQANENILNMAGCYDVTYQFNETETAENHVASKDYLTTARELIVVDKNTNDEIHLQHILLSQMGIMKHWRQEWYLAEKMNKAMVHTHPNLWEMKSFEKTPGLWIQYVGNTDDAPRYACAAKWENNQWSCDMMAPLPRREYTKRNDYNIMLRGNVVTVNKTGWVHDQKNQKILENNTDMFMRVGTEVGSNVYTKIADTECGQALSWWKKRKAAWLVVQNMWRQVFDHHNPLLIDTLKGETPLSTKLDNIVEENLANPNAEEGLKKVKKQSHDIIHEYMLER